MPFTNSQLVQAIEQNLYRIPGMQAAQVLRVTYEDVFFWGLSTDTFARCEATVSAYGEEERVKLIIKRWVPGGPTDVDMGVESLPREALAFDAGLFDSDTGLSNINAPFVATLHDRASDEHWVILRDVSAELDAFRSPVGLLEIERRYAIVLENLALMHAAWEKPEWQSRLKPLNWLVKDSTRLARGCSVSRYVEGLPLSASEYSRVESVRDWIQGARIEAARQAFYDTLSPSDVAMWKFHECDRRALIAAFSEFPTTLVHGDVYPLNVGLRNVNGQASLTLIDWEWIGIGCAALDVAKLLSVGAVNEYVDFDSAGLADYYFERYTVGGGIYLDLPTWQHAYDLSVIYHALIVHPVARGWAILDDTPSRACLEVKTPQLAGLIAKYLGMKPR